MLSSLLRRCFCQILLSHAVRLLARCCRLVCQIVALAATDLINVRSGVTVRLRIWSLGNLAGGLNGLKVSKPEAMS